MRFSSQIAILAFCLACGLAGQETAPPRVGVGAVQRKMSLEDAIAQAVANNLDVEVERTNIASASAAARGARGFYDPTFRWTPTLESRNTPVGSLLLGAGGKLSEHFMGQNFYLRQRLPFQGASFGIDFENQRQSSSNPFNSLNPFITSRLLVSFTQPLVRNREIDRDRAQLTIRRKQVDISETQFEMKAIDIVAQVETAYWNLVAARQNAQVQADSVGWAREQLLRNKRMVEAGTLAPVELAASEAELERRRDTWFSSVDLISEAENVLKSLITGGRKEPLWADEIIPTEESTVPPPNMPDVQQAVNEAVARRPELKVVAGQQEINAVAQKAAANEVKPLVNFVAGYANSGLGGSIRSGDNFFTSSNAALYDRLNQLSILAGLPAVPPPVLAGPPGVLVGGYGTTLGNLFGGNYQSASVGLSLDLNIRNATAEANLAQTAIAERRLKLDRARLEQAIQVQMRNALQSLETARQRIQAAEASVRAAQEKLESETRLFQTGESTNFLVLTRQNEYADSRQRLLVAKLDHNKAVARLEQAAGTTLESHKIRLQ